MVASQQKLDEIKKKVEEAAKEYSKPCPQTDENDETHRLFELVDQIRCGCMMASLHTCDLAWIGVRRLSVKRAAMLALAVCWTPSPRPCLFPVTCVAQRLEPGDR